MGDPKPNTLDHYVPRMYLKRFAKYRSGEPQIIAMTPNLKTRFQTSVKNIAAERGFYWATDINGVPHHHLETFLTSLESEATTAFRRILDSGSKHTDDALPRWPPRRDVRLALSWWIAAQILRTVRQRTRLDTEHSISVKVPSQFDSANRHIRYIAEMVEDLTASIFSRPWGVGFSDYCLITGDVPVLVLNGQDHPDQSTAVKFWDLYLPMDPHRCLYLPGMGSAGDRAISRDHRFKLHPGHAIGLNSMMLDTAIRHVLFHPDHDPTEHAQPAVSTEGELPQFLMRYEPLPPGVGIHRKWLDSHPKPTPTEDLKEENPSKYIHQFLSELKQRQEKFGSRASNNEQDTF